MPTIESDYIFIPGPGVLQRQTYTTVTANQFKRMSTFGATGGQKLTTNREIIEYAEGTPAQVVVRDVVSEKGNIEITLLEQALEDLTVELGDGTVVDEIAAAGTSETHHLFLRGYGYQLLAGVRADGTISAITSADATPVTFSGTTDYTTGNVEGTLAVARISGTTTITDGEEVIVTVTYNRPARKYLSFGGRNAIAYNHLLMTKVFRDGVRREFTFAYKGSTTGTVENNYNKSGYTERTCNFGLMSDTTRTSGDRIWRKYIENAV